MKKQLDFDFSIITNTCIGGVIYHKLGMKFLSPTINLWISQPDFVKFCLNMEHYLSSNLVFFKKEGRNCPCARLDDIEIIFNHYSSEQEAANKWYDRIQRINYDRLYIITSDGNGVTDEELNKLDDIGAKRVVVFTSKRTNVKNSFLLYSLYKYDNAAGHMIHGDLFNTPTVFREFNFRKWIAMRKNYRLPMSVLYFIAGRFYRLFKSR